MLWVHRGNPSRPIRPSQYVISQGSGDCAPAAYGMYTSFAGDVNAGGLYFYVSNGRQAYHAPGVSASQIWDGNWHMVTGTFDGSKARFYLDGRQVGSGTSVPGAIDYSQPDQRFVLGSYGKPAGGSCAPAIPSVTFAGWIDEVRIYDGALGETTVQRISDFGGVNPPPALPPDPPVVHTTGVDQISPAGARVNGTIDDNGASVPFRVEYGKTTAYDQASGLQQSAGADGVKPVSISLGGLEPDTAYHARLVSGSVKGEDVTFRTEDARPAVPVTTIALDPAAPLPAGFYQGFVEVTVTAAGRGALDTRCVLDPSKAPASFADLPSGCKFARGARVTAPGRHVVYAATRDAAGHTEAPPVSRTFTISYQIDTTITSGPSGETWRPNNLFYFTATELPATYECRVDGRAFAACTSPFATGALGSGDHTFAVRAIASGGAVDPTPAESRFAIAHAFWARADCNVQPVRFWPITGWDYWGRSLHENDKSVCEIGTPGKVACTHVTNCVVKVQQCPYGARCTITTKAAWFDADKAINWGVTAIATVGRFIATPDLGSAFAPSLTWPIRFRNAPTDETTCNSGFNGDHCYTPPARLQVLGGSNKWLLSACQMTLTAGYSIAYNVPSTQAVQPFLGHDSIRRIECNAEWRVEPAPELAAVPAGRLVEVNTIAAGILLALPTIMGSSGERSTASAGAAASARSETAARPKIAAVRKVVRPGGDPAQAERGGAAPAQAEEAPEGQAPAGLHDQGSEEGDPHTARDDQRSRRGSPHVRGSAAEEGSAARVGEAPGLRREEVAGTFPSGGGPLAAGLHSAFPLLGREGGGLVGQHQGLRRSIRRAVRAEAAGRAG